MDMQLYSLIIVSISFAMVCLSLYSMCYPNVLVEIMPRISAFPLAKYGDISIRVMLGVSLVLYANESLYPSFFLVLGWISIIAAAFVLLLGNRKIAVIIRFTSESIPIWGIRLVCGLGVLFFMFIIYATNVSFF